MTSSLRRSRPCVCIGGGSCGLFATLIVELSLLKTISSSTSRLDIDPFDSRSPVRSRLRGLSSILPRICVEFLFAALRTEIIGCSCVFGCPGGVLLVHLHSTDRIGLCRHIIHSFSSAQFGFSASLPKSCSLSARCASAAWSRENVRVPEPSSDPKLMQYRGGQICDEESNEIAVGFMECSGHTSAADSLSKA